MGTRDKSAAAIPVLTAFQAGGNGQVSVPSYDRKRLTGGIAHIGVGNFHRVHQGLYLDDLLHLRNDHYNWGIVGVGLRNLPGSVDKARVYGEQDNLYTVTTFSPEGARTSRIIGSMIEYHCGPANPARVVTRLSQPDIRIVSLTVTEGGYNLDEETRRFRNDAPEIVEDLQRAVPQTTFGVLCAALDARRKAGAPPFAVLSCDNLRSNGATAKTAVLGYAQLRNEALAKWIDANVTFPNSMVDRIAPTVNEARRKELNALTGVSDGLPALGEEFRQWVIEDCFCAGRPAWEDLGVELRSDVEAFEAMKGRMLNASHMLLSYPGALAGHQWVHEAARDPKIAALLNTFMERDAAPQVEAPRGASLADYQKLIVSRFTNENVPDTVLRVAHGGGAKLPIFHRKTCEGLLRGDADVRREAFLLAAFRQYTFGVDRSGAKFEVNEPHLNSEDWTLIQSEDPMNALFASPFKAWRLGESPKFVNAYLAAVKTLLVDGVYAAIDAAL